LYALLYYADIPCSEELSISHSRHCIKTQLITLKAAAFALEHRLADTDKINRLINKNSQYLED